jgi:Mg-chelatase subunit ChlD
MKLEYASILTLGALISIGSFAACGVNKGGQTSNAGSGGSAGSGFAGSGGNQSGAAGTDIVIQGTGGASGSSGSGPGFTECAKAENEPTTVPLHMYLAVDKSGSMQDNNKWGNARAAFLNFFQDPANAAAKISVALRFWPDGQCSELTCDPNACEPPQVALGPLSDQNQVTALVNLFNSKSPSGNTPMMAALGGASQWAIKNAQQGEGAVATVIVFVTDGEPNGCNEDINAIASNAANAYMTAEVPTFAVGMVGSNEGQMDIIAQAGNTQKAFLIGNGNAEAELVAALKEIQKTTLACVFAMPEPAAGEMLDPKQVNLTYTPTGSDMPITIGQVDSEAACSAAGGWGWFYDDPNKPAVIQLCPDLCNNVQKDTSGKIKVILGCDTEPA